VTGIPSRTILRIKETALKRGFQPDRDPRILESYVEDAARPGRPKTITPEIEEKVLASVTADRSGREKSSEYLAYEVNITRASALRILHAHGFSVVKPTRRPGLTPSMKAARLAFCKKYQYWTLEDWKNVIWTDETSVVLGHRRGSVRLWRRPDEAYEDSCIRSRWKGFSEFMFWGSFTWFEKGPCHIWKPETKAQQTLAQKHLDQLNVILEAEKKIEWEVETGDRRINITRNLRGSKPTWKWNVKNGKLVRDSKGGIDWYRYWQVRDVHSYLTSYFRYLRIYYRIFYYHFLYRTLRNADSFVHREPL
jgi:hypothetical protein